MCSFKEYSIVLTMNFINVKKYIFFSILIIYWLIEKFLFFLSLWFDWTKIKTLWIQKCSRFKNRCSIFFRFFFDFICDFFLSKQRVDSNFFFWKKKNHKYNYSELDLHLIKLRNSTFRNEFAISTISHLFSNCIQ